jgi:hypothetical protein
VSELDRNEDFLRRYRQWLTDTARYRTATFTTRGRTESRSWCRCRPREVSESSAPYRRRLFERRRLARMTQGGRSSSGSSWDMVRCQTRQKRRQRVAEWRGDPRQVLRMVSARRLFDSASFCGIGRVYGSSGGCAQNVPAASQRHPVSPIGTHFSGDRQNGSILLSASDFGEIRRVRKVREGTGSGSAKPPPPVQIRAAPPIFVRRNVKTGSGPVLRYLDR